MNQKSKRYAKMNLKYLGYSGVLRVRAFNQVMAAFQE